MAWSTPRDWTTDEVVTAANMDTYISDNLTYLYTQVSSQFMLSSKGGTPSTTSGCAGAVQVEFGTNDVDLYSCAFDGTAVEYMQWSHPMPSDYGGGTVTAKFFWYCPSADTDSVKWGLQGTCLGDGDAIDATWGTVQEVTDANNADKDLNITAATAAITIANTPVAGDMVQWRVQRDPTDGEDDLDGIDALLLWVAITYTRT